METRILRFASRAKDSSIGCALKIDQSFDTGLSAYQSALAILVLTGTLYQQMFREFYEKPSLDGYRIVI